MASEDVRGIIPRAPRAIFPIWLLCLCSRLFAQQIKINVGGLKKEYEMSSENIQSAEALLQALAGMLNDYFCEKQPSANLGTVLDASSEEQGVPIDAAYGHTSSGSGVVPWGDLTGLAAGTNLLYKMPPEVTAKMNWVIDNIPRMSKQRIVRTAVNTELERLIELYHRP